MSAGSHSQEPLDVLIQRITNPLNETYDPQLVYAFCERIKQQQDGALAATRLLAYRVQSPQEREALLALDLLDTCARTGGPNFQSELGKFRFLNELIKLLSPRYLGPRTPQRVKQRVVDLMVGWARAIPHETKIQEAFSLLEKQGLLELNGITPRPTGGAAPRTEDALTVPESADPALDVNRPPTPPLPPSERPANPIFEDGQKAALLRRLLQSKHPEDIQAANRLIKTMVKQDEERSERVSRRVTELETVHSNLRLLQEMMDSYSPESTSRDELELMSELCASCRQLRGRLDTLAAEADDQDSALADLVSASELIGAALSRHAALLPPSGGSPLTLLQLEETQEQGQERGAGESGEEVLRRQLEQLGLSDPVPPSAPVSAPSANQPPDLLGSPLEAQPAPQAAPPLAALVASSIPVSVAPPVPLPVAPPVPPAPPGSGLGDLLGPLGGAAPVQAQGQPAALTGLGRTQQTRMAQPQPQPAGRSAFDDLDDLVRLSMAGTAAPAPAPVPAAAPAPPGSSLADRLSSAPPSSLPTNQSPAPTATPRPPPPPANPAPPPPLLPSSGAEPNGHRPIPDLLSDDVSLLSTLSGPGSDEALLCEGAEPVAGGRGQAAGGRRGQAGGGRGLAAGDGPGAERPSSLAEVAVTLEEIQPGTGAPLVLFSEPNSLEISLHPAGNRPRSDVTVYVITALNRTGRPVSQYTLQAVCDKTARVRLLAPTSTELPAGSPFLPPPAVSQPLLLARPDQQMIVHLRFMLSYAVGGDTITEMAETTLPCRS